jgi:hypothetical protein
MKKLDKMNIEQQFGLTHLLDIFAYIEHGYDEAIKIVIGKRIKKFSIQRVRIRSYAKLLKNTKLEKWMFIGDKAIFEGFFVDIQNKTDTIISNGVYELAFLKVHEGFVIRFCKLDMLLPHSSRPKTLSNLADLTKDNPLKLK